MNEGPALSSAMGLVRFAFLHRFVCAYQRLKMGLSALLRHRINEVEQIEVTLIKLKFVITWGSIGTARWGNPVFDFKAATHRTGVSTLTPHFHGFEGNDRHEKIEGIPASPSGIQGLGLRAHPHTTQQALLITTEGNPAVFK
jgi:hypothetical protein